MSLPLSCEPTAIQFPSACRIPDKDPTTTNTEQPEPINYWLCFEIHQSNKKTVEIMKNATVIVSLFDKGLHYLFVQPAAKHLEVCHSVVCYFFSTDLFHKYDKTKTLNTWEVLCFGTYGNERQLLVFWGSFQTQKWYTFIPLCCCLVVWNYIKQFHVFLPSCDPLDLYYTTERERPIKGHHNQMQLFSMSSNMLVFND